MALNATQFNISRVLGPALAGLLMASSGVGAFAVSAFSYVPFLVIAIRCERGGQEKMRP